MRQRFLAQFYMLTGMLVLTAPLSCSGAADWQAEQIADALRAAPPSVTHTARIYAWQPSGQLVLVRDGAGLYTCVASGSASLRFGQPPLPDRDPFCADQNAWAFIQAYWTEEDPDPTESIRPLPQAPGLVWMLAGRQVGNGHVASSEEAQPIAPTGLTATVQPAGQAAADTIRTIPQLMILPLPLDPAAAELPKADDPTHPLTLWMKARGIPFGHMLIHFPEAVQQALATILSDPSR